MSKVRTIRITLDIDVAALPREDWEEELAAIQGEDDDIDPAEESDDWPLDELSTDEVASCVEQATYDPGIFAGSMLYLKVTETRIVSHEFADTLAHTQQDRGTS